MYVKIKKIQDEDLYDDVVVLRVLREEDTFHIQMLIGPEAPMELERSSCDAALNDFISRSLE